MVELSVIVSVAASATVGYLSWTQPANITDSQKAIDTKNKIEEISKAIEAFRVEKGRMPCPADPYMRIDNTRSATGGTDYYPNDYGVEDLDTIQTTVNGVTTLGVDCPLNIGSVPVHSLGLSNKYINDGWDRRFTYQVSKNLCGTDPGTEVLGVTQAAQDLSRLRGCTKADYLNGGGDITVKTDASGQTLTANAAYVLISHGANGKGAFLPSGERNPNGTGNELENSNDFPTSNNIFIKAAVSSSFDDVVYYKTKTQVERLTDRKAVKQVSVEDCEANSLAISQIGTTEANAMGDNISNYTYGTSYNNGQQVGLGILMAMQSICVKDYGATAATINNKTWSGAKCPIIDPNYPSVYDSVSNSCGITAFRPTDIANLKLWLDASDLTTIYGTTTVGNASADCQTGTSPVDGSYIGCWKDKSGLFRHAINISTAANRPIYAVNQLNGKPMVNFTGTANSYLISNIPSYITSTTLSYTIVTRRTAVVTNTSTLSGLGYGQALDHNNTASFVGFYENTGTILRGHRNGVALSSASTTHPGNNVAYKATGIFDGTNHTLYLNGTAQPAVATSGNFNLASFHIGDRWNSGVGGNIYNGYIAEIIIYDAALTTQQRQNVETYLSTKWGI